MKTRFVHVFLFVNIYKMTIKQRLLLCSSFVLYVASKLRNPHVFRILGYGFDPVLDLLPLYESESISK